jgi:hypothetical protein
VFINHFLITVSSLILTVVQCLYGSSLFSSVLGCPVMRKSECSLWQYETWCSGTSGIFINKVKSELRLLVKISFGSGGFENQEE